MQITETYKALADESRLRIVAVLRRGYFNVQELTEILDASQSTISHHLKILSNAGLIRSRKEGTWSYYTLSSADRSIPSLILVSPLLDHLVQSEKTSQHDPLFAPDRRKIEDILARRREQSLRFFESVAGEWQHLRTEAQGEDSVVDRVLPMIPKQATVLELGCGSGSLLDRVTPRDGITIGVDYSPAMLDEARRTLGERATHVDLRLGSLEHLPVADNSIDLVIAYMVLHHIPTPADALKDAARVLSPGGKVIIVDLVQHDSEFMRERYADLWLGFDTSEFSDWVTSAGLKPPQIELLGQKNSIFLLTTSKGTYEG